jgi:hypothetical protein
MRATTFALPRATDVTTPCEETVAAFSLVEDQDGTMPRTAFCLESRTVYASGTDVPAGPTRDSVGGAMSMPWMSTTSTGTCAETSWKVAVIVALPAFFATTRPPASTSAMAGLDDVQSGFPDSKGRPFLSRIRAVRRCARSMPKILIFFGAMSMDPGLRAQAVAARSSASAPAWIRRSGILFSS